MAAVTISNSGAALASEVLVDTIGIELAQKINTPETTWLFRVEGKQSDTGHYRWENAFSTSTEAGAVEGSALPVGSWSLSEQTISAAFEGQSIPVGAGIISLMPESLESVTRQTSTVLERAIDSSVCALYPSFTQSSVGSSGQPLTVSNILSGNAELDAAHADQIGPYKGRLAPHQFLNLYQDILSKNYGIAKISVDAMGKDTIEIGATELKRNTFVPTINSGANYNGGIYVYQAIGVVMGLNPTVKVDYLMGTGSYYVDGFLLFGTGILRANLGVPVISGVTA
jgi:hypothetical protein